ncbi:hypothetical protein [Pseudanabaena sp. PCC 6802]|uniref:hypothetical protein n=1 Tax=Pseudanabaena sp. PCC 6802 TaxID=118173 RepID=UPI00034B8631|nr:hypothetical protein [Pseudanabaena sp. PCC 6802]
MYSDSQLTNLFNQEILDYLYRKNRGGVANQKGNTYENFFAICQIVLIAPRVIESGEEIYLASQVTAFVDDLIVDLGADTSLQHFQLKNSPTVSWGTNTSKVRIAYDFRQQKYLNTEVKCRNSELFLVVSSEDLQIRLADSMPSDLKNYSHVAFFPYLPTVDELLQAHDAFRQAIAYLTAFEQPTRDKIECVAKVLLGAWVASDKTRITVLDILKSAQKCQPSFIRSFLSDDVISLDPEVVKVLEQIPGFYFSISRGFFHWEYIAVGWFTDGTFPHSCDSEAFQHFQDRIKQFSPSRFEDLEILL